MTLRRLAIASLCFIISACDARNPAPALQDTTPEPEAEEAVVIAPIVNPRALGLELFDSEQGISLLDVGLQDDLTGLSPPKFALHCDTRAKTLEAVAPARQLGAAAVAGPADLVVSDVVFSGEAVLVEADGAAVSLTLPLTPDLLAKIATATSARVVMGEAYAQSNPDITGAFPGFAGQCSLQSGVPLPPR